MKAIVKILNNTTSNRTETGTLGNIFGNRKDTSS